MTGYGKAEAVLESGKIVVEIRSVNSKNADIAIKSSLLPKDKEMGVRTKISQSLTRGNIDLFLTYEPNEIEGGREINLNTAMNYYEQVRALERRMGTTCEANAILPAILKMPDIFDCKKQDIITDENWPLIDTAIDEALVNINDFRTKEGASLYADVTDKVRRIQGYVDEVEKYESERIETVRTKILAKFEEMKQEPDQSRLEQEMIFYIEKLDINEEKVRLRQHCKYFLDTIDSDPCPGKKLGFIAQEMGREINTTGSKANHAEIQKIVVLMKDDLEKIKEQSLNIL